jgi:hypothetical protein
MRCAECEAFLANYRLATNLYAKFTQKLSHMASAENLIGPKLQRLKEEVQTARSECIRARAALRLHKDSHQPPS